MHAKACAYTLWTYVRKYCTKSLIDEFKNQTFPEASAAASAAEVAAAPAAAALAPVSLAPVTADAAKDALRTFSLTS